MRKYLVLLSVFLLMTVAFAAAMLISDAEVMAKPAMQSAQATSTPRAARTFSF